MGAVRGDRAEDRPAGDASSERLQSWKELAAYLKRGARTVQRWEREEGLPVRRLQHGKLGSIYGYKSELDAWWAARGEELSNAPQKAAEPAPSVAVLPFSDMSPGKDQGFFCEGLVEEIVHALSRISGLRTVSRNSSSRARAVLEGSVRRFGDQCRITIQLVESESGLHLWSERFDRIATDAFGVQDEIAGKVSHAVAATLQVDGKSSDAPAPPACDRAEECYRRGREFFYDFSPGAMEFAIQLFVRAIETDPGCANAYAGLADCWSFTYLYSQRSEELREQADWASQRAIEMNPQSAQAHASRGLALSLDGRNQDAGQAYESAARLEPGLFEAWYYHARHCFALGELERAAEFYGKAIEVRADDYQAPLLCAQVYRDLGRHPEAAAAAKRGIRAAEDHLKWNPDDARALYLAANGLAALGEAARARQFAERAIAMRPDDPVLLYNVACTFALLEDIEPALEALENAARRGLNHRAWYERDSNLDCLRTHPRFQTILDRIP
jgi:adenylate cyclase